MNLFTQHQSLFRFSVGLLLVPWLAAPPSVLSTFPNAARFARRQSGSYAASSNGANRLTQQALAPRARSSGHPVIASPAPQGLHCLFQATRPLGIMRPSPGAAAHDAAIARHDFAEARRVAVHDIPRQESGSLEPVFQALEAVFLTQDSVSVTQFFIQLAEAIREARDLFLEGHREAVWVGHGWVPPSKIHLKHLGTLFVDMALHATRAFVKHLHDHSLSLNAHEGIFVERYPTLTALFAEARTAAQQSATAIHEAYNLRHYRSPQSPTAISKHTPILAPRFDPPTGIRPPHFLLVLGPSGSGKSSLARRLVKEHPREFMRLLQVTTRPIRPHEEDASHRQFLSYTAFNAGVANGTILAPIESHGHRYGIDRRELIQAAETGRTILMETQRTGGEIQHLWPGVTLDNIVVAPITVHPMAPDAFADHLRRLLIDRIQLRDPGIPPEELLERSEAAYHKIQEGLRIANFYVENPQTDEGAPSDGSYHEFESAALALLASRFSTPDPKTINPSGTTRFKSGAQHPLFGLPAAS